MYLPEEEKLPIRQLASIFGNMSESYKIFWFQAIVNYCIQGREKLSYEEIIHEMIAEAWYMVSEYKLNLGPSDTLEALILEVFEKGDLKAGEGKQRIMDSLKQMSDKEIEKKKKTLALHVPYRLQAPFLPEVKGKRWDHNSEFMAYANRVRQKNRLLYYYENVAGYSKNIILDPCWAAYIKKNQSIINGWIKYNMILYLQKRNPNVPGISSKLLPPMQRKLEKAGKLWRMILDKKPLDDIYSEKSLTKENQKKYGSVSIDHFIPWSYVAHDELWNLAPTFQSINSSKGNSLPDIKLHLDRLCEMQYEAYCVCHEFEEIREHYERCKREYINSQEAMNKLYCEGMETAASSTEYVLNRRTGQPIKIKIFLTQPPIHAIN